MTTVNFMEKHIQVCLFKNQSLVINNHNNHNNHNNTINIVLNSYERPYIDHLMIDGENMIKNRSEIYRNTYYNDNYPQNHSILYDEVANTVKFYDNNDKYNEITLPKFYNKVSYALDKIQGILLDRIYIDPVKHEEESIKLDKTYSIHENSTMIKCSDITINNARIPIRTRQLIEEQKNV
jgi:hypothetical protein